jgi:hypothetical protein
MGDGIDRRAIGAGRLEQHRGDHARTMGDRCAQRGILGRGLHKEHVIGHHGDFGALELVDQFRMDGARPWPCAQALEAVIVDRHDQQAWIDLGRAQADQPVIDLVVDPARIARPRERACVPGRDAQDHTPFHHKPAVGSLQPTSPTVR